MQQSMPGARQQRACQDWRVPKVCQLGGCAIYVNADDHFPAHFHVPGGKGGLQAWIEIDSLAVRHTNLHRADLGIVLNWAAQRQDELRKAWEQAKVGRRGMSATGTLR